MHVVNLAAGQRKQEPVLREDDFLDFKEGGGCTLEFVLALRGLLDLPLDLESGTI